jgi:hypothetical protein
MTKTKDAKITIDEKEYAVAVNGKAKVSQRAEQNVATFGLA